MRLFDSGLMAVMLKLTSNTNPEIVRQMLKCIGAMCIARTDMHVHTPTPQSNEVGGNHPNGYQIAKQYQTYMYSEALVVLTTALSSSSSFVQLEAARGIANIAGVDEQMCDLAVAGSLRTIISMLLDITCDRDTRAASEDVLRAAGFVGGIRDLEVCQYDVELLGE